jgi:hypothetical protein
VDLAGVDGGDKVSHLGIPGQDDAYEVRVLPLRGLQEFDAGHVRHLLVRDHGVDWLPAEDAERLFSGLGEVDGVSVQEGALELLKVRRLVVDEQ